MNPLAPLYRTRQFFAAIFAKPDPAGLSLAQETLSPGEAALFARLQASEQAHAINVLRKVIAHMPEAPATLRKAALLHDIGKAKHRLRLWERVAIVIGQEVFGARTTRWGVSPPNGQAPIGWRRPFIIRELHPHWGAVMAQQAGSSPGVVSIIRRHQDTIAMPPKTEEEKFLLLLQSADNQS